MIELFIEGYQVDISQSFSTLLTMAIDDIRDFGSKNTTFSKTIILPGTKRNNKLFGNIFDVNAGSTYDAEAVNIGYNFNAAVSAKAYIFADNIQVFKGIVRIMEIVVVDAVAEYEVSVFGELGGLVLALGNKKLEELDFSAYNLTYSAANIAASWDNTPGTGVYFPLMDYGNYSTGKHDWQFGTFRPALYAKEYLDKIFTAAGYTYSSDLIDGTRFKGLVVPHAQKILTANNTQILSRITATQSDFDVITTKIAFGSGSLGAFTTSDNITFTYGSATPVVTDITLAVVLESYTGYPLPVTISLKKNGSVISSVVATELLISYDLSVSAITFNNTDSFEVVISRITLGNTISFSANIDILSATAIPTQLLIGDTVKVNDAIPRNILQKDFLSSIVKLFNLYVYEDKEESNKLYIKPFIEYYDGNPFNAVDWSTKVDRSQPMRIKPMSELNSRYYQFNMKDDADFYNDLYKKRYNLAYGSYLYDSQYEFANDKTAVDVIFSGTPLVGYTGEDKIYSTIFKRTGTTTLVEENIDSNIRLLQTKKVTGVSSWNILDGATVLGSYTAYGYAGHFDDPDVPSDDIQFGTPSELFFVLATGSLNVNQFNVYWSPYMAEITDKDSRLLTATMRLNGKDIYNLDFSKLINIDGGLYRINQIIDYNASMPDTCSVELLRAINLANSTVAPTPAGSDEVYTYTGDGTETNYLSLPALAGMNIILVVMGTKVLEMIPNLRRRTPNPNQVKINNFTGTFTFGVDIQPDQVIHILYNR